MSSSFFRVFIDIEGSLKAKAIFSVSSCFLSFDCQILLFFNVVDEILDANSAVTDWKSRVAVIETDLDNGCKCEDFLLST